MSAKAVIRITSAGLPAARNALSHSMPLAPGSATSSRIRSTWRCSSSAAPASALSAVSTLPTLASSARDRNERMPASSSTTRIVRRCQLSASAALLCRSLITLAVAGQEESLATVLDPPVLGLNRPGRARRPPRMDILTRTRGPRPDILSIGPPFRKAACRKPLMANGIRHRHSSC
ncbi:hypothetical protein D9M68_770140 [compost metagenome]